MWGYTTSPISSEGGKAEKMALSILKQMASLRAKIFNSGRHLYELKTKLRTQYDKTQRYLDKAGEMLETCYDHPDQPEPRRLFDRGMDRARSAIAETTRLHGVATRELKRLHDNMGKLIEVSSGRVVPSETGGADPMVEFYQEVMASSSGFAERHAQSESAIDVLRFKLTLLENEVRDADKDEAGTNETRVRKWLEAVDDTEDVPTHEWVRGREFATPKRRLTVL